MADRSPIVQQLRALQLQADTLSAPVQRMDEEELMQGKAIQRAGMDEEEMLQGKMTDTAAAPASTAQTASGGLPADLRSGMETLSGMSLGHVSVQRNSNAPAAVNAHATAQGSTIHLAPGQDQHLPHEAWHVVQQAQGRVKPTTSIAGQAVNDDPGLETEADTMGARAAQLARDVDQTQS